MESGVMVSMVMALSELVKRTGIIKSKYVPLVNLVMGIVFSVAYNGADLKASVLNGIVIGLVSTGLYSGAKNVINVNVQGRD